MINSPPSILKSILQKEKELDPACKFCESEVVFKEDLCQFISNAIETHTDFETLDYIHVTKTGGIDLSITGAHGRVDGEVIYIDAWAQSDQMDESLQDPDSQLHSPVLESPHELQEYIDWGKVCSWIEPTEAVHYSHSWRPNGFRVIDVQQNLLIEPPENCEYFALSYVFGGAAVEVPQQGKINKGHLPVTIRDAMVACVEFGVRYLWVDQLCINQSDKNDLQQQIDCMGLIYEHATCTLVALAGENAYYGLPGVTSPRFWNHRRLQIGHVLLVEDRPNLRRFIDHSAWSTRGWTFQEAIFSSQFLFFTEYGVYYAHRERRHVHSESNPRSISRDLDCLPTMDRFWEAHTHYTRRILTYDSDTIRAFTGVLQKIYGDDTYYGLPIHHIHKAISWVPSLFEDEGPGGQRDGFPSWSWASCDGVVRHSPAKAGLALWAIPAHGSKTGITICTPAQGLGWCSDDDKFEYDSTVLNHVAWSALLAWLEGCIPRRFPAELSLGSSIDDFRDIVRRWPTYDAFWQDAFGGRENDHIFSDDDQQSAASIPGSILVHAHTSSFHLEPSKVSYAKEFDFWIRASDGSFAGTIKIPQSNKKMRQGVLAEFILLSIPEEPRKFAYCSPFYSIDYENLTGCLCLKGKDSLPEFPMAHTAPCEACQLKYKDSTQLNNTKAKLSPQRRYMNTLFYWHPHGKAYPFIEHESEHEELVGHDAIHLNVMLIERDPETNIARRLGIGDIYLKKWVEARPEFRTIILQ
ncbi:hypothetical protein AWENTII_009881 [Aspergillus wentii]